MIDSVSRQMGVVEVAAHPRAKGADCPWCGHRSTRVHSRYQRALSDAAVGAQQVRIRLTVRRFFCDNDACEARTFAEQVDGLTVRHGRRSVLLRRLLERIGLALAGRAGARLSRFLGAPVSPSTMLRLVRAVPDAEPADVSAVGVDDFALRRGYNYGTIIIDAENHVPLEVLADREAASLTEWLKTQDGIEVICRDRAGAYAQAGRDGAPQAIQVADRWHIWHNLAQAVDKTVASCRSEFTDCRQTPAQTDDHGDVAAEQQRPPSPAQALPEAYETRLTKRTRERYKQVRELREAGYSIAATAHELGLDRHTVRRFDRATGLEELLAKAGRRDSKLDQFKPYLHEQFNAGLTDAAELTRRIQRQGYAGSEQTVRRYLAPFRPGGQAPPATPGPPSCRSVTGWLTRDPDDLTEDDKAGLEKVLAASDTLTTTNKHVTAFAKILTQRQGERLPDWMETVDQKGSAPLKSFVKGLRKDIDAVTNGLTMDYNSGFVEGTVNRIKFLKRQMYGRAKFDLLRKRILHPV